MKLTWFVFLLSLLIITSLTQADEQWISQTSFLEIGASARSISVGSAFIGLADDVSATYWNPAGLAQLEGPAISIMDRLNIFDTNYANSALAFPIGSLGIIGLNFTYYGVDEIIAYNNKGQETGNLTDKESALAISYAYSIGKFLIGTNLKYIYKRLDSNYTFIRAGGFGLDAAILYKLTDKFSVGAVLHDSFTMTYSDDYKETAPMSIGAGCAYKFNFGDKHKLAFMLDFEQIREHPLKLHFGSELTLFNFLSLRAGVDDLYAETRDSDIEHIDLLEYNLKPAVGIGIQWEVSRDSFLTIDYALSFQYLDEQNFFTVGYAF